MAAKFRCIRNAVGYNDRHQILCPILLTSDHRVKSWSDLISWVIASVCYLDDMLSAGGGCKIKVTSHVKTACKRFRELLPVLTSRHLSYKTHGHVYSSCVGSAILQASETWPLTKTNLQCLQSNDWAMIRQICSIKPDDVAMVRSSELLAKLEL